MSTVKTADKRWKTKEIFATPSLLGSTVTVKGWVRTIRSQKTFAFVELNDGSQLSNIQIVLDSSLKGYEDLIEKIQTGAAISVTGELVQSPGGKQSLEIKALKVEMIGEAPSDYILQKKQHSFEFLRSIAHLRARTNTFGAVARVRSSLAVATHLFFAEKGFLYVTTPMITSSDCEGAGELFTVTSFDLNKLPKTKEGTVNFAEDFFGKEAYLIVSGQLHGETYAQSLSDIYTFGPTFRAENSNTSRHLAEFWMIEPEMAFADLNDNMTLADEYLKFLIRYLFTHNLEDLQFFDAFVEKGLINRLELVANTPCARVTYTEAITILEKSGASFEFPVSWGIDLQSEHERFLSEKHFKSPVIVYNYPKKIKPFYMRANDDGLTVASMDLLVPVTGELIGGGQREERLPLLEEAMKKHNLNLSDYSWYLDLRRYGSTPHAGFGLGFERLIQYTTGMENIRDVIPFPRYPKHADY
jgi:asparaginyl-tRNA synthetase